MINCYTPDVAVNNTSPSGCTCTSPTFPCPSAAAVQTVAPFLYFDSLADADRDGRQSHLDCHSVSNRLRNAHADLGHGAQSLAVSTSIPF